MVLYVAYDWTCLLLLLGLLLGLDEIRRSLSLCLSLSLSYGWGLGFIRSLSCLNSLSTSTTSRLMFTQ